MLNLPRVDLPRLSPRAVDAHKGDFGNALLLGGSRGMSGAIALTGMAALRAGAGLVRLAVPDCCLETVAAFSPCAMTIPLAEDDQGRISLRALQTLIDPLGKASCLAIGPGFGQSPELQSLVQEVVRRASQPLVIDADGLNNLSTDDRWASRLPSGTVLTPHPGEWSRLCGVSAADRDRQCQAAAEIAAEHRLVIVLKGHRTLVTDGRTAVFNETGTPAMATGGSGDVLTGLITALICQKLSARDAAHLAVHVHGLAGQLAAESQNSHVVLPTELIEYLPAALHSLNVA